MIKNPVLPEYKIGTLIGGLISWGIIIAVIMTFIYLVWGGIQWISSGGDKAGIQQARERITSALIGLALVVAAWALMQIISRFLGFSFPNIKLPTLSGT
jgi:uncharacterized membrane protein